LNTVTDVKAIPISRDGYIAHKGFLEALDQVWDEISQALAEFLKSHPGAPVYFTGHSLGAALATIAAARFKGGNSVLYTIGSPRVGDDKFVAAVEHNARLKFRFVNAGEIVTQVPPDVPLGHYRHVGVEKYIDRNGVIHDGVSNLFRLTDFGNGVRDHGGASVLRAIADLPQAILAALSALKREKLVDPPPYIVGNHTPARYAIHIWNHYSGR
jgi:pimeloyl-ACP methyl ester carboxylesterase